jgi:hypothetical protein
MTVGGDEAFSHRAALRNAAAQTRIISAVRIRPDSRKSVRPFKRIIRADISEFRYSELSPPTLAVPTNIWSLGTFRFRIIDLWRR